MTSRKFKEIGAATLAILMIGGQLGVAQIGIYMRPAPEATRLPPPSAFRAPNEGSAESSPLPASKSPPAAVPEPIRLPAPWEATVQPKKEHMQMLREDPVPAIPYKAPPRTEREPMIERQDRRLKLRLAGDIFNIVNRGMHRNGFQTLSLKTGSAARTSAGLVVKQPGISRQGQGQVRHALQPLVRLNQAEPPQLQMRSLNQPYDYTNANTNCHRNLDANPDLRKVSETYYGFKESKAIYLAKDGTKFTVYYDQSMPIGQRNTQVIEYTDGRKQMSSPLVFDLKGYGIRMSDRRVRYDLKGDGRIASIPDIASTTGILVFDSDGDGVAGENGRELFGDRTDLDGDGRPDGYADGFEALEALVRKAEREKMLSRGTLERGRLGPAELARLGKAYGLGMRVGGFAAKTVSLEDAGVREIVLSKNPSLRQKDFDSHGNDVVRRQGAVFVRSDGSTGSYEDVFPSYEIPKLRPITWPSPHRYVETTK